MVAVAAFATALASSSRMKPKRSGLATATSSSAEIFSVRSGGMAPNEVSDTVATT